MSAARAALRAGAAVAPAGDVGGDGITDLLVGAPGNNILPGRVYVLFGGRCQTVSLANLGTCGFAVTGPLPNPVDLLSTAPSFGSTLSGPQTGDAGTNADFNGDGLDDIVIGNARADENNRVDSGSTFVIFGKADNATVDVANLSGRGLRIDGPGAAEQSGWAAAPIGDVNADDIDDVLIGAPGASPDGRAAAGTGYVVFGRTSSSAVDLANLGTAGYRIIGAANNRVGSSVTPAGDVDGDQVDDVALGGRGTFVVLGHPEILDTVDLADPEERGFRMGTPGGQDTDTLVSALPDANDDGRSDLATSAPTSSRAYALFSQGTLRHPFRSGADPATAGAQETQGLLPSAAGDGNARSIDGFRSADGRSAIVVGAPTASPNGRANSGSAYVTRPAPPPAPPVARAAQSNCAPVGGYTFFRRDTAGTPLFNFFKCRRTDAGNIERQPSRTRCGMLSSADCDRGRYTNRGISVTSLNARVIPGRQLNDSPSLGMVEVSREAGAIPQDPADPQRREFAWPLLDSVSQVIGYIRELPSRPPVTDLATGRITDPGVPPRTFRLWNDAKAFMGSTDPARRDGPNDLGQRLQMEGQPCATTPTSLRDTTALVVLFANGGSKENGNALTVRGLLPTVAFGAQSFTDRAAISNSDAVRSYYAPCSRPKRILRNNVTFNYKTPAFVADRTERIETFPGVLEDRMIFGERYQSRNAVENLKPAEPGTCGEPETAATKARCSATYQNYTFPQAPAASDKPQYPPFAVLVPATTGVNGGGITRGLLVTKGDGFQVRAIDRFRYLDKNIPCGQNEIASWTLIRTGKIHLWAPRRIGDANNPAPSRPALALAARDNANRRECTP